MVGGRCQGRGFKEKVVESFQMLLEGRWGRSPKGGPGGAGPGAFGYGPIGEMRERTPKAVSPRRNEAQSSPKGKSEGHLRGSQVGTELGAFSGGQEGRGWGFFPSTRLLLMLECVAQRTHGREEQSLAARDVAGGAEGRYQAQAVRGPGVSSRDEAVTQRPGAGPLPPSGTALDRRPLPAGGPLQQPPSAPSATLPLIRFWSGSATLAMWPP